MRRRTHRLTCIAAAILLLAAADLRANNPQGAQQHTWETLKTERANTRQVAKEAEIEIKTANGVIIITTGRQVEIKVFSIIGRQVSQQTLAPGTHQLQLPTHGVYIVKVDDFTCKVAI